MAFLLEFIKGETPQASIFGVVLSLVIVLVSLSFWRGTSGKKYPAGPKPWPVIGNMLLFSKIIKDSDKTLISIAKEFGDFCMLWLLSQPVLFVAKLADANELLDKVCLSRQYGR